MKAYTEEMRLNDEYPTLGQKVILNILPEAEDSENNRRFNGCELVVVKNRALNPVRLPIFYCVEHEFQISINNAHFKVIGTEPLNEGEEIELKSRDMVSELNKQGDNWPQVGDHAMYGLGKCVVLAICDNQAWVKFDNTGLTDVVMIHHLDKPKTEQELKIEELQDKLCELNPVDNYTLACDIVMGNVEGLSYE